MKFALFLILLVGFVCATQARSNVLDDLFLSSVSQNIELNDVVLTCNATDSCAGKGDSCKGNYGTPAGCQPTNGTCCAIGLFCINSSCVTDTVGLGCNSNSQCVSDSPTPLNCIKGTCTYVYSIGDSCSVNTDCQSNNCTGGVCQGGMLGQACAGMSCNFGLWCMPNMTSGMMTCMNRTGADGNCTSPMECMEGTTCYSTTQGGQATCQTIGTQSSGGSCMDSSACSSGNVCYPGTGIGNCTAVQTSMVTCTNNTQCTDGVCACSTVTGDLFCVGATYNNPCTSEMISLQSCLASSSCVEATDAPNSCCYANCLSEYKKSMSCGCSFADSVSGDCSYNQYCGGFPVWAIIVIIVVAIVLVLAIVLLVFFMMRRRRQYDSI